MTEPFHIEGTYTFDLDDDSMAAFMALWPLASPRYNVTLTGRQAVALRTGPRPAEVSRAEWRRRLRAASWLRRRQRRTRQPAATMDVAYRLPRAALTVDIELTRAPMSRSV